MDRNWIHEPAFLKHQAESIKHTNYRVGSAFFYLVLSSPWGSQPSLSLTRCFGWIPMMQCQPGSSLSILLASSDIHRNSAIFGCMYRDNRQWIFIHSSWYSTYIYIVMHCANDVYLWLPRPQRDPQLTRMTSKPKYLAKGYGQSMVEPAPLLKWSFHEKIMMGFACMLWYVPFYPVLPLVFLLLFAGLKQALNVLKKQALQAWSTVKFMAEKKLNISRRSPVNLSESSPLNGRTQLFSAASSDGGPVQRKICKVILGGFCAWSIHWELYRSVVWGRNRIHTTSCFGKSEPWDISDSESSGIAKGKGNVPWVDSLV